MKRKPFIFARISFAFFHFSRTVFISADLLKIVIHANNNGKGPRSRFNQHAMPIYTFEIVLKNRRIHIYRDRVDLESIAGPSLDRENVVEAGAP